MGSTSSPGATESRCPMVLVLDLVLVLVRVLLQGLVQEDRR